ncbi:unnamed protein product, partial [Scytosiphon promiscuus]
PHHPQPQKPRPGAACATCGGKEAPLNFCSACDVGFHPGCLVPPKSKLAGAGWVCGGC